MLAATLTGGKLALLLLPNIEIVTLLIITYTFVFGLKVGLATTLIFVVTESFLQGFNTWIIAYFIHWPALSLFSFFISKLKNYTYPLIIALATLMTASFGVLTSLIDALIGSVNTSFAFSYLFPIIYLRGIPFYVTHLLNNVVVCVVCFLPLSKFLTKLKFKYYHLTANEL